MTSLLVRPDRTGPAPARSRPLVLVATLAGVTASLGPLVVLLALGVIGWFISDAGAHGAPRDGMEIGALTWLAAHGSGVTVMGARIGIIPLGVTAICAWTTWRVALRAGESLADHGPDARSIEDGERDWTVPMAVLTFGCGYAVVAVVTATLAGTSAHPSLPRVLAATIAFTAVLAAPAIAVGSGRAAIWLGRVPLTARVAASVAWSVLVWLLAASAVLFLIALALSFGDAATMTSRLHPSPSEAGLYSLVNVAFLPNAVVFTGSWLLGPGFVVGGGTLVSPSAVVLGPLPLFPLLAALPAVGTPAAWVGSLIGLPPIVAAIAAVRVLRHRRMPWDQATLAACSGGIVAGFGFGFIAMLSGGPAGPGRMRHVGPMLGDVLVHAVTACAIGALVGALLLLGWQRWRLGPVADEDA